MIYDDETIMAYVDGELDAAHRARIDAAVAADPVLAQRVQQQRTLREKLAGAFSTVLDEPIPSRLEAAARGGAMRDAKPARGKVVQFPARAARAPAPPWRAREWTAMAASLLVGVLLSWRVFTAADSSPVVAGKESLVARGELAQALDHQLASEQQGGERVVIGLTFKSREGVYCRSFVMRATRIAGVACRAGSEWQIPATDSSERAEGEMQQAGSALPPSILRIIGARMEGAALDSEGEKNAQTANWELKR